MNDKARYMTVAAFAKTFGFNEQTVRRWCRDGNIEAVVAPGGRGWRISRSQVDKIENGDDP